MSDTTNNLEFQNREIKEQIDDIYRHNIDAGLGKTGLGDVLSQEVINAKECGDIYGLEEQRIMTGERYIGRNLVQEVKNLNINKSLPDEEKRIIISDALDCRPNQISFNREEALSGNDIVYHHGNLDLDNIKSADDLILPLSVGAYIDLDGLKSADNLILPQSVGSLSLRNLTSAVNLDLPNSIEYNLYLPGLISIENLDLSNIKSNVIELSIGIYKKYKDVLESEYPDLVGRFFVGA